MKEVIRRVIVNGWSGVCALWLVLGVCVLVLALAELSYRLLDSIESRISSFRVTSVRTNPAMRDPQAAADWYSPYWSEFNASSHMQWKPYVYFRRPPLEGHYVAIDSLGHRVTQPHRAHETPGARVYFFGGSTMWGTGQRNEHTIASEASRRFEATAGMGPYIEVTNFGEAGYVFTQELFELELQLSAGNRPDVVVFYDGINDVAAAIQSGTPGIPQNEGKRISEFAMGRALDHGGAAGVGADMRALRVLAGASVQQFKLGRRIEGLLRRQATPSLLSVDSAVVGIAQIYSENVRIVEALGRAYDFTPIFIWQPTLHATLKQLTPYEEELMRSIGADAFQLRSRDVHRAIPARLDSVVGAIAGPRFIDAASLFRGDTSGVYIDRIGHTTESAVPQIVDAFWSVLQDATTRKLARHR